MVETKTAAKKKLEKPEFVIKPKAKVEKVVETEVEAKKPRPAPKMTPERLNLAAEALLKQLPDHAGDLVVSLSKQFTLPIWQYVTGILLAVHLEGRLSEFRLDPAWKDGLKQNLLRCQWTACGKMFKPRHIGQKFCSNDCGNLATGPREIFGNVKPVPDIPTSIPDPTHDSAGSSWTSPTPVMEAA